MPDNLDLPSAAPTTKALPDAGTNTSGQGKLYPLPEGVAGWSWGAFIFSWVWAIGNRTWWGLFGLIPGVGLVVRVLLGMNGRRSAWQNRRWNSVEHFNRVQRRWSMAGGALLGLALAGIVAAIAIPIHQDRQLRQPLETAFVHANKAAQAVGGYIEAKRAVPHSLDEAGFSEPLPAGIQHLAIDPRSGELRVTVNLARLRGKDFYLMPATGADGAVSWRCLHGGIPERLLPQPCRGNPTGELEL